MRYLFLSAHTLFFCFSTTYAQGGPLLLHDTILVEDARGNLDTLSYAFLEGAQLFDETYGESQVFGPFDSLLEARFVVEAEPAAGGEIRSAKWTRRFIGRAERCNSSFGPGCYRYHSAKFVIYAKYPPITVRWNPSTWHAHRSIVGTYLEAFNIDVISDPEPGDPPIPWYEQIPELIDASACMALDSTFTYSDTITKPRYRDGYWHQVLGDSARVSRALTVRIGPAHIAYCDVDGLVVSTNTVLTQELLIYPNPANHVLRVSGDAGANYQLLDTTGKPVGHWAGHEFDVSALPSGLYVLRSSSGISKRVAILH